MNMAPVQHDTFVIERTYDALPERVYQAWSDPKAKAQWFAGPDEFERSDYELDFRVGGREAISGGPPDGPLYTYEAIIRDIVPNERIIHTYEMKLDGKRISVSVATMEFHAVENKTRLVLTEQGAYLDGLDNPAQREQGTRELMDALRPLIEDACEKSPVPCHFLDLRPVFEGRYDEFVQADGLNPTAAGSQATADAIWAILQELCIAQ
jgi:uncharacterized protein YndB with AHSA1/START domain